MTKNISLKANKKRLVECINSFDYLLHALKTVIADIESGDGIIPCETEIIPLDDDILHTVYLSKH